MEYQQPVVYMAQRPTSGTAVTGLILSLFGVSLPGLIVSIVATGRTKTGELGGHGLAIAGIVLGGLGTIVWALLVLPWLWVALFGAIGAAS